MKQLNEMKYLFLLVSSPLFVVLTGWQPRPERELVPASGYYYDEYRSGNIKSTGLIFRTDQGVMD